MARPGKRDGLARILRSAAVLLILSASAGTVRAQSSAGRPAPAVGAYADFFELARPGSLTATAFGGGFTSAEYATTQEGFQLEQSITPNIALAGRVTGYQLFVEKGFDNPLAPGNEQHARYNFGRLQAGLNLEPYPNTHFVILGGGDVGDSNAAVIEGGLSTWLWVYSPHPINFAFDSAHDFQNGVTSSEIDLRTVVFSRERYMVTAGGAGEIYGGGFLSGLSGQGGPSLAAYLRHWNAGVELTGGYGTARAFVQLNVFKQLGWSE